MPEGPPTPRGAPAEEDVESEAADADPLLGDSFRDDFERPEVGPDYNVLSDAWRMVGGWLCARGAKNHGAWLKRRLPENVSIQFDAVALSEDGDLKVELFGDGASGATKTTYDDATGYVAIFGGWKNSLHVLARLDEHGADRKEIETLDAPEDPRARRVKASQPYHFKFERRHGRLLLWIVDGTLELEIDDSEPLRGPGHEHFAFNDWEAPVCFDNLEIEPL